MGLIRRNGVPEFPITGASWIEDVYPGIDVMYGGTHGRLQCHFLVAPGAKPNRITLAISGATNPRLDAEGNLTLHSGQTKLRFFKPAAYQDVGTSKRLVSARYVVSHGRIKFVVTEYDRTKPLIIDPILSYAAYLTTPDAALSLRHGVLHHTVMQRNFVFWPRPTKSHRGQERSAGPHQLGTEERCSSR